MKLEYLPDGSPDCPLVRIYQFGSADARDLKDLFLALAGGALGQIALHELSSVESVDGCQLSFIVSQRDEGVIPVPEPPQFVCRLVSSTWKQVAERTEPFCQEARPRTYQWVDETSNISILLSPDGFW
jgi:hypothetical protein